MATRISAGAVLTTLALATATPCSLCAQTTPLIERLRFLTSSAERRRLDALRHARNQSATNAVREATASEQPPPVPTVSVQGIVVRSKGPDAVWVNDGNTLRDDRIAGGLRVQAGDAGQARIALPDGGAVDVRPGLSYDPVSGSTIGVRVLVGR